MIHYPNPLEQFEIIPLIGIQFGNVDLSFTNSSLLMLISVSTFLILVRLIAFKITIIPTRWQFFVEAIFEFILTLVLDNVGNKGQKFFPFIFVLFVFILFCNLLGMVPYSFTVTSHLIVTFCLALGVFIGVNVIMIKEHQIHAIGLFMPSGSPLLLAPMLVVIEILSYFIRVISLSVRLFANLMSGHILLKVLLGFAWSMVSSGGILLIAHIIPLSVVFLLIGLEFGVAIIQAYVFTILTCLYLNEAIHLH
jgi:ATP synthase subunit 6